MRSIFLKFALIAAVVIFSTSCDPDSQLKEVEVSCHAGVCEKSSENLPSGSSNSEIDETISVSQVTIVGDDNNGREYSNGEYAKSCSDYRSGQYYDGQTGDGIYNVQPDESVAPFKVYCDMEENDGGWTLVWSNLRGGVGKPFTGLDWATATTTIPIYDSNPISTDLESFIVYTGVEHYENLSPEGKIRYQWSHDFGEDISHALICDYELTEFNFALSLTNCTQELGATASGFLNSSGRSFQVNTGNDCDSFMTPFWYTSSCIDGAITGGGEGSTFGIYNGAYWTGDDASWGNSISGTGAGNGWISVK
ncbi:fibrinogen-like YCDxxxxGGGW domain-containing protein [Bacteriovoracaceae bacterium]|nr:fibrinogen-like YCDxxxxGGGW domain-containing protein [Bacteriovoracaceae bacterium]